MMTRTVSIAVAALALAAFGSPAAEAKGCLKGAAAGGIAGHMAGHGKAGAAVGCAVGHHRAGKKDQAPQGGGQQGQPQGQ